MQGWWMHTFARDGPGGVVSPLTEVTAVDCISVVVVDRNDARVCGLKMLLVHDSTL